MKTEISPLSDRTDQKYNNIMNLEKLIETLTILEKSSFIR